MSVSEDRDELLAVNQRSAELMEAAAQHRQKQQAAEPTPAELLRTSVSGSASVTVKNGMMEASRGGSAAAQVEPKLPDGMVKLPNGMVTSIEAAKAAGFDLPAPSFNGGTPEAPQTPPEKSSGQAPAAPIDGLTEDENGKIERAHAVIAEGRETVGEITIQTMQEDAVASGELPRHLPEGVTQEHVGALVDGYTAQANAVLRPTGASVEALNAFLNENELREARVATYRGDDNTLRTLGGKAMERLERLPNDPVHFSELTAGWPSDVKVERRDNTVYVKAPEWPRAMKWGDAVRTGKIRL